MCQMDQKEVEEVNFVNFMSFVQESSEGCAQRKASTFLPSSLHIIPPLCKMRREEEEEEEELLVGDGIPFSIPSGEQRKDNRSRRGQLQTPGRGNEFFLQANPISLYVCACLLATGIVLLPRDSQACFICYETRRH